MASATKTKLKMGEMDLPTARRMMERHPGHLRAAARAVEAIEGADEYVVRALYDRVHEAYEDAWEIENIHDDALRDSGFRKIASHASTVRLAGEAAAADPLSALGSHSDRWIAFHCAAVELAAAIEEWLARTEDAAA